MTGSHIDTVRAGREVRRRARRAHGDRGGAGAAWQGAGRPKRPLEVLVTCEEEGSRFACSFWGARAIVGRIRADETERIADADGVTIGAAMQRARLRSGQDRGGRAPRHRGVRRGRTSSRARSSSARGIRSGW